MKKCNSCLESKNLTLFPKRKDSKDGLRNTCKLCVNLDKKDRYQSIDVKNKEKERHQIYYKNNKETIVNKTKEYKRESRKNIEIRLRDNLRNRLNQAIKNDQKAGSAVKDLGCSIEEFKSYLESKFQSGMTWENWTKNGWHIDHIVALANFKLENRDEFLIANHYSNLQPMWADENLAKGKS